MGHYNDFDLDVKKVQENGATPMSSIPCSIVVESVVQTAIKLSEAKCTEMVSCNGGCTTKPTCNATCGGLKTSCGGHCR